MKLRSIETAWDVATLMVVAFHAKAVEWSGRSGIGSIPYRTCRLGSHSRQHGVHGRLTPPPRRGIRQQRIRPDNAPPL